MSGSKRSWENAKEKNRLKRIQLPDSIEYQTQVLEAQSRILEEQKDTIASLNGQLQRANSFQAKIKEWIAGAIIGIILTTFFNHLFL